MDEVAGNGFGAYICTPRVPRVMNLSEILCAGLISQLSNRVREALTKHNGELVDGQVPRTLGIFQSFSILRKPRNSSLVAASSLGKWPRFLTIFRRRICRLSMALVV